MEVARHKHNFRALILGEGKSVSFSQEARPKRKRLVAWCRPKELRSRSRGRHRGEGEEGRKTRTCVHFHRWDPKEGRAGQVQKPNWDFHRKIGGGHVPRRELAKAPGGKEAADLRRREERKLSVFVQRSVATRGVRQT